MRNTKCFLLIAALASFASAQQPSPSAVDDASGRRTLIDTYCIRCHNQRLKTGGMVLEGVDAVKVADNAGIWERVLRQVGSGQMPPAGLPDRKSTRLNSSH